MQQFKFTIVKYDVIKGLDIRFVKNEKKKVKVRFR